MNIIRWHGLDLPEFPTEDVLCLTSQYVEAAASGMTHFIRKIETTGPKESLKSRIDRVTRHLNILSELCEIKIVDAEYGLCRDIPEIVSNRRYQEDIVPSGYLLAARVEAIGSVGELPEDRVEQFSEGYKRFRQQFKLQDSNAYSDAHLRQIVYGIPNSQAGNASATLDAYYVDPDLISGPDVRDAPLISIVDGDLFIN
jgi:hypothetical protein